jgi:hypothetical protein
MAARRVERQHGSLTSQGAHGPAVTHAWSPTVDMEGWFCSDCKSLNGQRMTRCYSCNTPRKFAEAAVMRRSGEIVTTSPAVTPVPATDGSATPVILGRGARPVPPDLSHYRPSTSLDVPVMLLLALCVGHAALTMMLVTTRGGVFGLAATLVGGSDYPMSWFLPLVASRFTLLAVTAALWFAWFDRVLQNVPVLTGMWPENSRQGAVGWWLVPGANLVRGPRVVGDVFDRLTVPGSPGLWLLAIWAASFIGAFVVPAIANRVLAFAPLPEDAYRQLAGLVSMVGQTLEIVAGLLAIGIVITLEHAQQVRHRRALDGDDAVTPPAATIPEPSTGGLSWSATRDGHPRETTEVVEPAPLPTRQLAPLVAAVVLVVAMSMTGAALGNGLRPVVRDDPAVFDVPYPLLPTPTPASAVPTSPAQAVARRGNPRVD